MTELSGRRVVLRPTRPEDHAAIHRWQNDPDIAWRMDYDGPFTLGDVAAAEARAAEEGHPFVVEVDGRPVGRIGLNGFRARDQVCSLYVFLGEHDLAGRHLGREAILTLLGWGFAELDLHLVELWGLAGNERALHTYEHCGFRREATLRERSRRPDGRHDRVVMSVTRPEFEAARAEFDAWLDANPNA
ncbi:MAG: GNAT family N-acetyltransferase [Actinomycetota bacterium]